MKQRIKALKFFPQVAAVIGEEQSQIELTKVLHSGIEFDDRYLINAFVWEESPQCNCFWMTIAGWTNPF
jgi:hypothetical protein